MSLQDASASSLSPNNVPSWPRPRSPIPPHRLAKLANALGISAPVPRSDPLPLSKSSNPPSPAPSLASTPQLTSHSPVPFSHSKFLLHVVPPLHIPHDSTSSDRFQFTHPPPSASGYHTQFHRGTLVPLLPTLQGQLWAIAKEYALPSTSGIILYLVSSAPNSNPEADEPGPRLSEDIWKHLWARVATFETETYSRVVTPNTAAGLGFSYAGPLFPQEFSSSSNSLRPLISPGRVTPQSFPPPLTPTGSTASSNPPTQASFSETSHSEVHSPDTSLPSDSRAATLDLPGLTSPSVIPILAKVEFDIDKRKATWYGPWIRSRKLNHQNREQRARTESDSATSPVAEDVSRRDSEADAPKAAALPLMLVDRQAIPRFLLSAGEEDNNPETVYPCLSESPPGLEDPDSYASSERTDTDGEAVNGIDKELRDSRERPKLVLDIPLSPPSTTAGVYKKPPPPPLTLMPYSYGTSAPSEPSPLPSSGSTGLAYLRDGVSTPSDGGKRTGSVFDELDLGLGFDDTGEFDENDPNDRRRSQYILKAKLDEIEKALVRLSPRGLQHESLVRSPPPSSLSVSGSTPRSATLPSFPSSASGYDPPQQGSNELPKKPSAAWSAVPHSSPRRQADLALSPDNFLAPPKLPLSGISNPIPVSLYHTSFSMSQVTELDESNARRELDCHELTYPEIASPSSRKPVSSYSPTIPLSPDPFGRFPSYPTPPSRSQVSTPLEQPPQGHSSRDSLSHQEGLNSHSGATSRPPSSRFSLDSTDEVISNRTSASLNPVKSIKSLWKRGRKLSISSVSGSSPALQMGSGNVSPQPPPPVPSLSSTPTPSIASRESVTSLVLPLDRYPPTPLYYDTPSLSTSQLQQLHSGPSTSTIIFNQESPYPIHILPPHSTARPRVASQVARIIPSPSVTEVDIMLPSATDRERAGAPKSILKSRRTDSSANSLPSEQQSTRRSQSRVEPVVHPSTLTGGGGRVTPPSSSFESVRVSPTNSRRRSSRAPASLRPLQEDETFKAMDPVPRLVLDQRTR